jgi:YD repeat-containing protein
MRTVIVLLMAAALAPSALSQTARTYEYDALGRLAKVTPSSGIPVCYTYDLADNRTTVAAANGCTTGGGGGGGSNSPPTANADYFVSYYINPWTEEYDVLPNDTDPNLPGDTLSIVSVTGTGSGKFSIVNVDGHNMLYWSGSASAGTKNFTYTMKDAANATSSASLTIQFIICKPGDECYGW